MRVLEGGSQREEEEKVGCGDGGRICPLSFGLNCARPNHTYIRPYIHTSQRNIRPGRFSHSLTLSSCSPHTFLLRPIVPQLHPPADRLLSVSTSSFPPKPFLPHTSLLSVRPPSRCRREFRTFGLSFPPVLSSDLLVVIPPSTRSGNGEIRKSTGCRLAH